MVEDVSSWAGVPDADVDIEDDETDALAGAIAAESDKAAADAVLGAGAAELLDAVPLGGSIALTAIARFASARRRERHELWMCTVAFLAFTNALRFAARRTLLCNFKAAAVV